MFLQHSQTLKEHSVTITSRLACQLLQHFRGYLSCRHLLWAIVSAEVYPVLLFPCGFPCVVSGDIDSLQDCILHMFQIHVHTAFFCAAAIQMTVTGEKHAGKLHTQKALNLQSLACQGGDGGAWAPLQGRWAVKVFPMTGATKGSWLPLSLSPTWAVRVLDPQDKHHQGDATGALQHWLTQRWPK